MNYLAILVAAVAAMVVGALWYGPLFGKAWMRMMGMSKESMGKTSMSQSYVLGFVAALLTAWVINRFALLMPVESTFTLAFWPWLGFTVPLLASSVIWEGKSWNLFLLNAAHYLVSIFVMALIITAWI